MSTAEWARFVAASVVVAGLVASASLAAEKKPLPIIPGAAGFGMETPAGSGRHLPVPQTTVYRVTNLNASGPGSLVAALEAKGPRVVVFEVSGCIDLDREVGVKEPYLTVAGQTAPWPGIIVRGGFTTHARTHDVLIQHVSFRSGDSIKGRYMPHRGCLEAGGRNVVVDHCATGWSQQCGLSLSGENVTARFCICSEGWYNAGHNEPEHAKGMFSSPLYVNKDAIKENTSILGCLFAHNHDRNPEVSKWARLVFVNNVIYNYAATGVKMMRSPQVVTIAGNVFALGVDTVGDPERPWRGKAAWLYIREPESRVFLSPDNLIGGKTYANPWEQVNARGDMSRPDVKPEPQVMAAEPPIVIPGYEVKSARETEAWVLANVGPFPARRNPIDARIVYETKTRTGRGRDDLEDVGGWPKLEENHRELKLPENPNSVNEDGYTNLEHWLQAFADEVEGRKGPVPGADPDLGKRETERCAKGVDVQALTAEMRRIEALPKAHWTCDAAEAKRRQEAAANAAGLPVTRAIDLGDGVSIELKLIPAGEFMMGSKYPPGVTKARGTGGMNLYRREYPARRVRITKPYYIGAYEVTWAVLDKVSGTDSKQDGRLPAVVLTAFLDGRTDLPGGDGYFIGKLNETVGRREGLTFRLPTEAEWEYACRAGTDTSFWFGEDISPEKANYNGAPWYPEPRETPYQPRGKRRAEPNTRRMMPVGSFAPNPWGLYDTVGNASELVQGSYGVYPEGDDTLVDPQGPTNTWGNIRIIRGGGNISVDHLIPNDLAIEFVCDSYPAECRSAYASYVAVYGGRERAGLRLVAEPTGGQAAAK